MNKKMELHSGNDIFCICPLIRVLCFLLFLYCFHDLQAQRVAIHTNVPEWCVSSPNLGFEFALNKKFTLDIVAAGCPFKLKEDKYLKHIRIQPELKYWFNGIISQHYVGLLAYYSSYDLCLNKKGYYGDSYAFGLTYGYDWVLNRRWNIEASLGIGAISYRLDRYIPQENHGQPDEHGWRIEPVKLAVSFVYIIK